ASYRRQPPQVGKPSVHMIPPMGRTRNGGVPMNMTLGWFALRQISAGGVCMRSMTAQRVGRVQGSSLRLRRPPVKTMYGPAGIPENALLIQTEVFDAWPRRKHLHQFVCILEHTTGAAQKASLYNISERGGSITRWLCSEFALHRPRGVTQL